MASFIRYLRRLVNATCDIRLKECVSVLGIVVLLLNITGYIIGYVQFQNSRSQQAPRAYVAKHTGNTQPGAVYSTSGPQVDTNKPHTGNTQRSAVYSTSGPQVDTSVWKKSPFACPVTSQSGRKRDVGRWYKYGVVPYQFYAYSAIWDDRPSLELSKPVIRIIAISSTRNGLDSTTSHPIYIPMSCRLYYVDGRTSIVAMETNAHPIGYGWQLNQEVVREFIFTCPSSDASDTDPQIPVAVEVLIGTPTWSIVQDSCMPIDFPHKPGAKRELAVCVQVAYGKLNALRLIEWFELQRLLGADMIGIYNMSIEDGPGSDVLRYYSQRASDDREEPFIDLRRSDYIIADGPEQYLLHGSPVINDCLYRHMYRFKNIVVVDFDEAITPQGNLFSLVDAIAYIKEHYPNVANKPVNYIFSNNYYFLDSVTPSADVTSVTSDVRNNIERFLGSHLTVLKNINKAPISGYGYAVKSIVDPQACLQMHNHYCWSMTAQYGGAVLGNLIDASIAVNQHYKYCHLNVTECKELLHKSTNDNNMLKYRDKLVKNVAAKIRSIFGNSEYILNTLL